MHKVEVAHVYFFNNKQTSDAGLIHLNGLPNLQELRLSRTKVTGDGIAELQQGVPNCSISMLESPPHLQPRMRPR